MVIGAIQGLSLGDTFASRDELSGAGVHRALQAGITGSAAGGAESIVLSGGYVDDEDRGDLIVYTGHGGRDPATGRQIADQEFTRQNQALVTSSLLGLPVRVIRGAGHKGAYSPSTGYRYDGLYRVEGYWRERGRDGFLICRFRLVSDRGPGVQGESGRESPAPRVRTTLQRIVRDTVLGREIKRLYGFACQVCGTTLSCEGGLYAEAAHIRPLGAPHDGPDVLENLLCLCPNHHVLFDNGGFAVADDLMLIGLPGRLIVSSRHTIDRGHLAYHRSIWPKHNAAL